MNSGFLGEPPQNRNYIAQGWCFIPILGIDKHIHRGIH